MFEKGKKAIYLAGFDVFAPDAKERGKKMQELCAKMGYTGLYPLDNEADTAAEIFAGNCALIDCADAVIANLNRSEEQSRIAVPASKLGMRARRASGCMVISRMPVHRERNRASSTKTDLLSRILGCR